MSKKMTKKKKKKLNTFFKVFGTISIIVAVFFCLMLFMLGMVPNKYLLIIYTCIFGLYFLLTLLTYVKDIKIVIKFISFIIFLICDIIFLFGIKYINDTIDFVNIIDNAILQKEEYYVMTLSTTEEDLIESLQGSDIGIYK